MSCLPSTCLSRRSWTSSSPPTQAPGPPKSGASAGRTAPSGSTPARPTPARATARRSPAPSGSKACPRRSWDFHLGGYQICHKWLKDRNGRTLSDEDIAHYQKIVVALNETISIMAEVDDVIEAQGGWPDAFQTASEGGYGIGIGDSAQQ